MAPVASPSEAKAVGESVSSKKKEKRKHVDHVESSLSVVAGTVQSSDDLDEELRDCKVPSRYSLWVGPSAPGLCGGPGACNAQVPTVLLGHTQLPPALFTRSMMGRVGTGLQPLCLQAGRRHGKMAEL